MNVSDMETFIDTTFCSSGCVISAHSVSGYCFGCQEICECNVDDLIERKLSG